ncbi:AAA family ATPase [Candidatus Burkholderia verschuerenii]|uniref:AAA family ATPase n=1 Tax=Candidatus Burkholderia verschuerenii TaxID=242163 RepID=UPI001E4D5102|nr:AAA family ATPase [Candidatus Burkholderia verschuerenii]
MSASDMAASRTQTTARAARFMAFVGDRQTEQTLRNFILDEALRHTHVGLGGVNEAIAHITKVGWSPRLLLIDLQGSTMPLSDLARLAEVCEPSVQVVALGDKNDVALYRNLLGIGIRDYLFKPLTEELLKRTVDLNDGAVRAVPQTRRGKAISFVGARGGAGTTTIAVNLARFLADSTHRRIAYVDLNINGGAACSMLGVRSNHGLSEVLQNVERIDVAFIERTMIPIGTRLFLLSCELPFGTAWPFKEGGIKHLIDLLTNEFHYVIIDTGAGVGRLSTEAFDNSARVYMISDRSVHGAHETVRLAQYVEKRENAPVISFVLNNTIPCAQGNVDKDDFVGAIGHSVLLEINHENKILAIAENVGEAPAGRAANAFVHSISQIVNDLVGRKATTEARGCRLNWWKR